MKKWRFDIKKPVHALALGLMLGAVAAPVLGYLADEQRYQVGPAAAVLTKTNPNLAAKLVYDADEKAYYFNRDGVADTSDSLALKTGGGGKASNQLYTAKLPDKADTGIRVSDNVNQTSVTMRPQFGLRDGRKTDGHILYPLEQFAGQLVFTPKANGLKEDILLDHAPGDRAEFSYELVLPDSLVAKMMPGGAVGIYSGDPTLFGNITYGSDDDRQKVALARKNAEKNYLMYEIPAPVVKQADGFAHGVKSRFELTGTQLKVITTGLDQAAYPLSIDPTFVITSLADFNLGRAEDNISFSNTVDGEISRASITGGLVNSSGWAQTASSTTLPAGCSESGNDYDFGMTAYNGYLYLVGGGAGSTTYNCDVPINSDGTLGTWVTNTTTGTGGSTFSVGRTGGCMVGWNGFVYMMGGETANGGTQFTTVEYAAVNADGSLDWRGSVSAMNVGRAYFGCTVYEGVIYAYGGATRKNNGTLVASSEYVKIKADGTLATWTNTTSFTTARDRFGAGSYNGYVYVVGGFTGTAALNDVQYAPIKSDGSLGTWVAGATTLPGNQRSQGLSIERGYIYSFGGCSTTTACTGSMNATYYAPVFADGSVGAWDTSATLTSARFYNGGASYNGVLYSVGGCKVEPTNNNNCGAGAALGDSQYAVISTTPGDVATPAAAGNTSYTARTGQAAIAYNGQLYAVGGCAVASCTSYSAVAQYAVINDDGSLGTWTSFTNALPAETSMNAGKYGGALAAYAGTLYFIGGVQKQTSPTVDVYSAKVYSTSASGTGTWTQETNALGTARAFHAVAMWNNTLYAIGGTNGTALSSIEYASFSAANALGAFAATTTALPAARLALGAAANNGQLYIAGGDDGTGTAVADMRRVVISSSGNITGSWQNDGFDLPAGRRYLSMAVQNNVLYVVGGVLAANAATGDILFARLNGATGAVAGSWTTSARTLATARQGASAAAYDGRLYVVGGCTSGVPCSAAPTTAVETARPNNGGVGLVGLSAANTNPWTASANTFTARSDLQTVAYNGKIYTIGGCTAYSAGVCSAWSTVVQHAIISETGNVGAWTATTGADAQLATGRAYGAAEAYNGKVYLLGGQAGSTTDTADVLMGTLDANGNISSWTIQSGTPLPSARHGFGATVSGQYLYAAGGNASGTLKNDVLYTQISSNGTLTAPSGCTATNGWCTSANSFTTARQDLNVVSYNSVIYVIGGFDGTNNLGDIQYAGLATGSNGAVGAFQYTTAQDNKARARSAAAANGYMYFFGSEASGSDVFYAAINANGTLGAMYRASNSGLASANHAHGGAVASSGYFYVIGGCTLSGSACTSTTGNSLEYAGQKASARLAHYSKLFNTQVDTAPAQLVVNGSLASGDSAFAASLQTSTTAAPTLGVAQLINPALPGIYNPIQALDASGNNVGIAYNYFIVLTLDDSGSGAFPDASSQITDFAIYYHANPGRRLRHGASFTNTGCNPAAASGCILDTAP